MLICKANYLTWAETSSNMPLTKQQKQKVIEGLKHDIEKQKSIVFIDFGKLDSKFLFELRDQLKESACALKAVKKTLLKKAFEATKQDDLVKAIDGIDGQLALAFGFSEDMLPAKICLKSSKENENLKILGGIFENKFIDKEKVIEMALLPSRWELLARLLGSVNMPISGFVNVLRRNIKGLLYVLNAIKPQ